MTECYRCGQEGHHRSQCPHDVPLPPAAPAAGRTAERHLHLIRDPPDPQLARTWAQVIRDTLGWGPPEERTRD